MSERHDVLEPTGTVAAAGDGSAGRHEAAERAQPGFPFANHLEQRTVVLRDVRVLYVPVPKAGCTGILWRLADLAGLPAEVFTHSTLPEVSPALTVHDMSLWHDEHRLASYDPEERERLLAEEGWLRFSVVRDPGTRLWSAWQSKLLLREPRFVSAFGDEPWFPRIPARPAELIEDFRRFVAALPSGTAEDVHWGVQHDLVAALPLGHVGRVEKLEETLDALRAHVPADRWNVAADGRNRTAVPMPPTAYDAASATVVNDYYRADFEAYGYELVRPAEDEPLTEWERQVEPLLPLLRDTIEKHTRIGQLHRTARRVQTVEERLETVATRRGGESKSEVLTNLERHTDFNVRWAWSDGGLEPGFTAVIRVKNEARSLPWILPPLLRAVKRVLVVDNGSTDGTADVARRVADEEGAAARLEVRHYPFSVARCGPEHLGTPPSSVHSLTYFYNWSFSHVRTAYALKWDGDMVLSDTAVNIIRDLAWQLEGTQTIVKIPRYPLYVADDRRAYLDVGMTNSEPWGWPNGPGFRFFKAMEWELPLWPAGVSTTTLPAWSCIELKHLDADEFVHWSETNFEVSARTRRKLREWQVFHALAEGGEPPDDVELVEAPADVHVIDYVRSVWLPAKASEPVDRGVRLLERIAG